MLLCLNSLKSKKIYFSFKSLEFSILTNKDQAIFYKILKKRFESVYKEVIFTNIRDSMELKKI